MRLKRQNRNLHAKRAVALAIPSESQNIIAVISAIIAEVQTNLHTSGDQSVRLRLGENLLSIIPEPRYIRRVDSALRHIARQSVPVTVNGQGPMLKLTPYGDTQDHISAHRVLSSISQLQQQGSTYFLRVRS